MGYYEHKIKEELLGAVEKLEKEVEGFSSELDSLKKGRFRERYSTRILGALPDMLTVFDHNVNIVELVSSPTTNHVEGMTAESIIDSDVKDIVPEEIYEGARQSMDKMIRTGESSTAERPLTSDDVLHHCKNRILPSDDQHLLCMCRDVSQGTEMAETSETQRSEIVHLNSLMNDILNDIPVYLFVKDTGNDFCHLYWNKVFAEYSGISVEKVMGSTGAGIFPGKKGTKRLRQDDLKAMELGHIEYLETYTTMSDEARAVTTMKTVVPSGGRYPYITGVSWDATKTKRVEKELVAARAKAEEVDRMKSSFLADMSHEVRTPLNAIIGLSELIIEADDEYKKRQYTDIIKYNSSVPLNLLSDILDLSAPKADSLELSYHPMKLKDIRLQLYELYVKSAKPEVRLVLDEVDPQLYIQGDQEYISQTLVSLIASVIRFIPAGEIHFGFQKRADMVQFYVSDTGKGVPVKRMAAIFQRFGEVDNSVQGTGLGLTIHRMFIEKISGRIWVCSRQGKGTVFYFTLPVKR